jgi:hypothetical protein
MFRSNDGEQFHKLTGDALAASGNVPFKMQGAPYPHNRPGFIAGLFDPLRRLKCSR